MSDEEQENKPKVVERGIREMKIKGEESSDEEVYGTIRVANLGDDESVGTESNSPVKMDTSTSQSPKETKQIDLHSPSSSKEEHEESRGGEIVVKMEPGQQPKLARVSSQKVMARSPQLFFDYEDKTQEAKGVFEVITECTYSVKYLGATEHAMDCDCAEEWGKINDSLKRSTVLIPSGLLTIWHRCCDKGQLCLWG